MTLDLWNWLHEFWPPGSVFRYFARHPGHGRVFGCAISTHKELLRTMAWAESSEMNQYWQPNPTRKRAGTRCSAEDVSHWAWFMLDIDPLDEMVYDPVAAFYEAAETLGLIPGAPLLVDSGRGIQGLYPLGPVPLNHPFQIDETGTIRTIGEIAPIAMRHHLEKIEVGYGCVLDYTSSTDMPRVMRLPGTTNQKTGQKAEVFTMPTEPIRSLGSKIIESVPRSIFQPPPPIETHSRDSWGHYTPHLTVTAQHFLQEGKVAPGRHHDACATMLSLIEQGATQDQTLGALLFGARLSSPQLPVKDVQDMVLRRFRKIGVDKVGA